MGISCGATVIKYILFLFNLIWLVLGGVVIWLGVTISYWSSDINTLIYTNMKAGAISVLVTGVAIFIIAFLGCCGAIKENSCMLLTYVGLIMILVVVHCVGVYFAFKNRTDIEDKITEGINREFRKFNTPDTDSSVNRLIQDLQTTFKCCGTSGPDSYGRTLPISCCGKSDYGDKNAATCHKSELEYKDGCIDTVRSTLKNYLGGLAGVAIALILIQLLIIMSACCLSREVRN